MSLLRDREFLKLWAGQTISEVGSRISREGLPLTALYLLNATPSQMGVLSATSSAAVLVVGLAAGVIADRFRRKPVMILTDLFRAVLLATIPLAALAGRLTFTHLLAVAAAAGICTVIFDVSYQAYLPSLVSKEEVLDGNRRLGMSAATAEILGPGLTGILIQLLTAPIAILLDAVSFVLSAVSLVLIRRPEPLLHEAAQGMPSRSEIFTGARIVAQHRLLRGLALRSMTAFFGMGILFTLYLLFAVRELGLNTVQLGFIIAMGGVGAFAGAWVTNRTAHLPPSRVFFLASLVVGTVQFLIPLASVFPKWGVLLLGAAQLFGDAAWSLLYVSETTYRQQVTIASALGRVNAAMQLAGRGVLPIGALTGGFLAERASVAATLWTGAALVFLATFWIPRREPARNPAA